MRNFIPLIFLLIILSSLSSCKLREKTVYFSKVNADTTAQNISETQNLIKLKEDDFISVMVYELDKESVAQFNLFTPPGSEVVVGYIIDRTGCINLPVIGKVKVSGLYKDEAVQLIESKLKTYFNNPTVQINILNFKVTILGEVNLPGSYNIKDERITILEAIGKAGDLKITGVRKNVLVIREEDGKKNEYRVDLTSKDVFKSPVYYLKQNDVVYVEPNKSSITNSTFVKDNGRLMLSLTSVIISILILINR